MIKTLKVIYNYYFKLLLIYCFVLFLSLWCLKIKVDKYNLVLDYQEKINTISKLERKIEDIKGIQDFFGIGGEGNQIEDYEQDIVKNVLNKYSVEKYQWKFEDIQPPFDISMSYITSEYGSLRKGSNNKQFRIESFDIRGINTDEIKAGITGIVSVRYNENQGNWLKIWWDDDNYVIYSHLNEIYYNDFDIILKGEILGTMGNSGHCMIIGNNGKWRDITENERLKGRGKHLDMTIVKNGIHRNGVKTSRQGRFYRDGKL